MVINDCSRVHLQVRIVLASFRSWKLPGLNTYVLVHRVLSARSVSLKLRLSSQRKVIGSEWI